MAPCRTRTSGSLRADRYWERGRTWRSPNETVLRPRTHPAYEQSMKCRNLVLTGPSGIGKSSLLHELAHRLPGREVRGFVSQAIFENGHRIGWRLDSFRGRGGLFIHPEIDSRHRFRGCGVDLSLLEELVAAELPRAGSADVYIVDEIGKVCPLSSMFVSAVTRLLDSEFLTVSAAAPHAPGFPKVVRERPDVDLWEVTRDNRVGLLGEILNWGGWGAAAVAP